MANKDKCYYMTLKKISFINWITVIVLVSIVFIQFFWINKYFEEDSKKTLENIQLKIENVIDKSILDVGLEAFKKDKFSNKVFVYSDSVYSKSIKKESFNPTKKIKLGSKKNSQITISNITIKIDSNHKKLNNVDKSNLKIEKPKKEVVNTVFDTIAITIDDRKLITNINKGIAGLCNTIDYQIIVREKDSILKLYNSSTNTFDTKVAVFSNKIKLDNTFGLTKKNVEFRYKSTLMNSFIKNTYIISFSIISTIAVIFCIVYLRNIIRKQKQLDQIKNDFISNVSHELKTPIAIVGVALESIISFNNDNNPDKKRRYISMAHQQLKKLESIVEKILETSSLNTNSIHLNLANTNISNILQDVIQEYSLLLDTKQLNCTIENDIFDDIDKFHFKNVFGNLLENAIKYGGNKIDITLFSNKTKWCLQVKDNGTGIPKNEHNRIFEKFYRISSKNVHDVKGFGIGLYYAKKIVEKHAGTIVLQSTNIDTTFIVSIPYEKN